MTTPAQQIRDLVTRDTVLMPGVYDAITARIAARLGFDIVFISGYSVSAARLGEPDFGFLTESEMADAARSEQRNGNHRRILRGLGWNSKQNEYSILTCQWNFCFIFVLKPNPSRSASAARP